MMDFSLWSGPGFAYDETKNEIWFATYWNNYLVNYSLHDHSVKRIEYIPEDSDKVRSACLFNDVKMVDGLVALIPCNGSDVFIYDPDNREFSRINLEEIRSVSFDRLNFAVSYKKSLYVFPCLDKNIYRIDPSEMKYEIVVKAEPKVIKENGVSSFQTHYLILDNLVFFLSSVSGEVFCFDMESGNLQVSYEENDVVFNTITHTDDGGFLLSTQEGGFVVIDSKMQTVIKRIKPLSDYGYTDATDLRGAMFRDCISLDGEFYLFPSIGEGIISLKDDELTRINEDWINSREDYVNQWRTDGYSDVVRTNEGYAFFSFRKGLLCTTDRALKQWDTHEIQLDLDEDGKKQFLDQSFKGVVNEQNNSAFSLKAFLDYVSLK